jgi:peptidoglycan hydrolase FlgJ
MSEIAGIAAAMPAPVAAPPAQAPAADPKLRAAAEEFEAMFVTQMLEHMHAGREPDSRFGGGHGEKTWQSVLNAEYGKAIAKRKGMGIADMLVRDMLKLQEDAR